MKKTVLRTEVAALLIFLEFAWERGRQLNVKPPTGFGQATRVSYVPGALGTVSRGIAAERIGV